MIKMKLSVASLLILTSVFGYSLARIDPWFDCPDPQTITPCECVHACEGDCNSIFHCSNLTSQSQFVEVIEKSDFPFRLAIIEKSALQYLPHKMFEEKMFYSLSIKHCTFLSLLDGPIEKDTPLKDLTLESLVFRRGFKFDVFSSMRSLTSLIIKNIEVKKIQSDICQFMPTELKSLNFYNTKTSRIGDTAFAACHSLKHLSIGRGIIKTIKSSMFPRELESLSLTSNKIKNLPDNFADDFPKLKSIYLDDNQLTYIKENIFGNFPALMYLNVEKNNIVCDCKLRWKMSRTRPYIEGNCKNLHDKRIYALTDDDLAYC